MIITHKISMDLTRRGVSPRISVVQGDENSRAVEVYLAANGCAWDIPGGAACVVRYKKSDGHGGVYSTMPDGSSAYSVNGNTVTVMLVPQVINVPGPVELSVAITEGNSVIGTFSFYVNVERDPSAGLTDSADYFSFTSLEEINTALLSLFAKTEIDASLKKSGLAADAAAVGAALAGKAPASGFESYHNCTNVDELNAKIDELTRAQPAGTEKTYYLYLYWYANAPLPCGRWSVTIHKPQNLATWAGVTATVVGSQVIHKLCREWYEGTWLDWEWENPPMVLGVEYRTTERWQGKAVYTKLVNCGNLPADGATVHYGINDSSITKILRVNGTSGTQGFTIPYTGTDAAMWVSGTVYDGRAYIVIHVESGSLTESTCIAQLWYIKD